MKIHAPETDKRLFYQQMSIVNGWSVRQLRSQEEAMVYERTHIAAKPALRMKDRLLQRVRADRIIS